MPTAHEAVAALPDGADADPDLLRGLTVGRYIYDLGSDDPTDFTAVDPDTGDVPPALAYNNRLYWYDAADTTTTHDGTTVLVSDDGKRFKLETTDLRLDSVLSQGDTSVPGSPSLGDAYIVGTGAGGAWAGEDDNIAVYAASGWLFLAPRTGRLTYVEDETGYYHYTAGGAWTKGLGTSPIAAGSLTPAAMINGGTDAYWRVVNETTTTPPGSPSTGDTYIVGPSATGAWSGHDAKLAQWTGAAWTITTPAQGTLAYNIALGQVRVYDTTDGWGPLSEGGVLIATYTISSPAAHQDIPLPAGYSRFEVEVRNLVPVTSGDRMLARVSNDGGSTFEAGASDYAWEATTEGSTGGDTAFRLTTQLDNSAGYGVDGFLTIWAARSASLRTRVAGAFTIYNSSAAVRIAQAAGYYLTAEANDALRILASTGNIKNGTMILRGWP